MSSPGLFGIYVAHRGMVAAQAGLNVVNHNIANANTEGFSKQRVELSASFPYQGPNPHADKLYQFGQGVDVVAVTRVRDTFLDTQYRSEKAIFNEMEAANDIFRQLEDVVGEPNDSGLASAMQRLFDAIQDMSNAPENIASRSAFLQQAVDVLQTMQQQARQVKNLHTNLVGNQGDLTSMSASQLGLAVEEVNTLLTNLAGLNKEIATVSASGANPNDLLDKRALTLENLSKYLNIQVTEAPNLDITVSAGGVRLVEGRFLRQTLTLAANTGSNAAAVPALVQSSGGTDMTNSLGGGKMKAILDVAGNNTTIKSVYQVFSELNSVVETLASNFNTVQQAGRDINGNQYTTGPYSELFSLDASYPGSGPRVLYYQVNASLVNNPDRLALAANDTTLAPGNFAGPGDNRNAQAFSALRRTTQTALNGQTYEEFHQTMVARLGINAKSFKDREATQEALLNQLDGRRQSVSGVNLDEETIDLLRFQRAFEASSRLIRTYNDLYDAIINMV